MQTSFFSSISSKAAAAAAEASKAVPSANKHTVDRLLDELASPGILERRARDAERPLVDYIDAEARNFPAEVQLKVARDLYTRLERRAADK